jgi:lysine 2,3-aminomutase
VLRAIRQVPSVEIIRLGTRVPVVLPMRVTHELVRMLRRYHPLWLNTHFNHPRELTAEAAEACARLADAGIPLGNQTVLLRGINDDARVMEKLFRGLVRHRVRPYYLFQCDLVRGIEHFRTPLTRGIEIMEYLRGRVSGLAIPSFCVDAPHGGGKIPLLPNYVVSQSPTHTVLRNFEGMLISYPEPVAVEAGAGAGAADGAAANAGTAGVEAAPQAASSRAPAGCGVWELARGQATAIAPAGSQRLRRRARRRSAPGGADSAGGLPGGGAKDGAA